ncbi:hypothetical protein EDC04DRAFT_2597660 [Pisolithus marmoratus]|nr:hypothetical protein EDC04DRAFT_2597660 [Pisolithus marmoratus]
MCMAGYLMEVWDIAKFTKKSKAKVPWGLLIKSPMEYLDSGSIPEGFTMKDPSKWTKADLGLLWDHWQSQEAEEKVIVSFIDCKKEDAPFQRQFDRQVPSSSKKKPWVDVEDDSEAEAGGRGVAWPSDQNMDLAKWKMTTCMSHTPLSLAIHSSEDQHSLAPLGNLGLECQVFSRGNAFGCQMFLGGTWTIAKSRFGCSSKGFEVVLGLGLLLRECSHAQEVEEDDPAVGHLHFLLSSVLGVQRGEDVMDIVGLEKEEEEAVDVDVALQQKRKRAGSGMETRRQKMLKEGVREGGVEGKRAREE